MILGRSYLENCFNRMVCLAVFMINFVQKFYMYKGYLFLPNLRQKTTRLNERYGFSHEIPTFLNEAHLLCVIIQIILVKFTIQNDRRIT